jgi:hypothetical protein
MTNPNPLWNPIGPLIVHGLLRDNDALSSTLEARMAEGLARAARAEAEGWSTARMLREWAADHLEQAAQLEERAREIEQTEGRD